MWTLLVYTFLRISAGSLADKNSGSLILSVDNIQQRQGTLWGGIYDGEGSFLVKEKALVIAFPVERTGRMLVPVPGLRYGTYAIALFHDLNGNDLLDQNFIGIPTEPFAFSKGLSTRWRLPKFREVAFRFGQDRQVLPIELKKWAKHGNGKK